jgi:phosphopantothenoylcysteine decarboxylase/phosphopantothenate--cysteine ligase
VPVLFAPAMNSVMWESPAMRNNLKRLAESGYHFVEPETGELACGVTGQGKMAEPQQIVESIEAVLTPNALEGLRVLITAGPTVEPIDPVRFISNHSSGKMGYALARAAVRHGAAQVKLISGPTNLPSPVGSDTIQVETAEQMYNATLAHFDEADIIIKTAAVCDWRPSSSAAEKIKKEDNAPPALELEATSDILSELGRRKRDGQLLVGFAAETENIEENARIKLKRKKLDLIVANDVTQPGAGFHSDTNAVKIISTDGKIAGIPLMDKNRVADRIIEALLRYRKRNKA